MRVYQRLICRKLLLNLYFNQESNIIFFDVWTKLLEIAVDSRDLRVSRQSSLAGIRNEVTERNDFRWNRTRECGEKISLSLSGWLHQVIIYTEKTFTTFYGFIFFSFAIERFFECLNLLQVVKPLRSFYIAKLELTSCHQANISVFRVVVRWRHVRQSQDDTERSNSLQGHRRTSMVRLNHWVDPQDMNIDFCL